MPVRAEPLKHGPLVHLPAPDQILEPDIELARRPQLPRALSRSSCVSRRQARKLATSLAASRTRPSMIFIWIPNDLRYQPADLFPANRHFRPHRLVRTFKGTNPSLRPAAVPCRSSGSRSASDASSRPGIGRAAPLSQLAIDHLLR